MTPTSEPGLPSSAFPGRGELAGKSAVVTGATEGIGLHPPRLLTSRGATVSITGRNPERGSTAVAAIRRAAGHQRAGFVPVDHSAVAANERLAAALSERFQRRADRVRAAQHCERLVTAEAGSIEGRYFDGTKPKKLPGKFADPGLPDRVQTIGTQLHSAAATAGGRT
jgi:NAD(P)-dependent dehydrogenase (short-subunit alcohol dehydrogenase family)